MLPLTGKTYMTNDRRRSGSQALRNWSPSLLSTHGRAHARVNEADGFLKQVTDAAVADRSAIQEQGVLHRFLAPKPPFISTVMFSAAIIQVAEALEEGSDAAQGC